LFGKPSPAKAGVPETWGSYQAAAECVTRGLAQGVGYEFDGSGICGIDLDHVLDGGRLSPQAKEIVGLLNTFTEISPSGTGLHLFVLAPGMDITRHRKKDCCVEIYSTGRYFTVTGNIFGDVGTIEHRTAELQAVHDKFLLPVAPYKIVNPPPPSAEPSIEHDRSLDIGLLRDQVFRAMWTGERRSGDESANDQAFMNKLTYWCSKDLNAMIRAFMSSPYYAQKDEAHKKKCQRPDYLPKTAVKACATVYSTAKADSESWHQRNRNREKSAVR